MRLRRIISNHLTAFMGVMILCVMLGGCMVFHRSHLKGQANPTDIKVRMKEHIHVGQDVDSLTTYLQSEDGVSFHLDTSDNTIYFERRFEPSDLLLFSISTAICGEVRIEHGRVSSIRIRQLHTGP